MKFKKKARHFKRYKDLVNLLIKYGQSDLEGFLDMEPYRQEEERGKTDPKAEELPKDLEKLGPTYIKLGQFLSTRPDIIPEEYMNELGQLQDNVEAVDYEVIEQIVSRELGTRVSKAFNEFKAEPLASASLGQIHFARLRDNRPVAVKVQRPGIREQIFDDLDAFEEIAGFLERNTETGKQFMLTSMLDEFRKSMISELDYLAEAEHQKILGENLAGFRHLIVPKPVDSYTTTKVLTMDFIDGKNIEHLSPIGKTEIRGKELVKELFEAYLQQILVDGFYHADPHPGNLFITSDGKLALIDLGMVGRVHGDLQTKLIRLLIALSEGKGDQAAENALRIGEKTPTADERNFRREVAEYVAVYYGSSLEQIETGKIVFGLIKVSARNGIRLPPELIMLGKALLNLDKAAEILDPQFDPNAAIRRNTTKLLKKKVSKSLKPSGLYDALLDTKEIVEKFPGRINNIMRILAANDFTVKLRLMNEPKFLSVIKEASNRLTLGMILAALIIGAALLMRVETTFTILGYPGIAILFFLLAALGGLMLAFRILLSDKNRSNKKH